MAAGAVLFARPNTDAIRPTEVTGARPELEIGESFAWDNAADFQRLTLLGRLPGIGWSVAGGLLIFCWSRRLFGDAGGLLSLAAWCFDPNVVAYAHVGRFGAGV